MLTDRSMPFQHPEHCGLALAFTLLVLLKALRALVLTGAMLLGSLCCLHCPATPPELGKGAAGQAASPAT